MLSTTGSVLARCRQSCLCVGQNATEHARLQKLTERHAEHTLSVPSVLPHLAHRLSPTFALSRRCARIEGVISLIWTAWLAAAMACLEAWDVAGGVAAVPRAVLTVLVRVKISVTTSESTLGPRGGFRRGRGHD